MLDQDGSDAGLAECIAQVMYNGLEIVFACDIVNTVLPQEAASLPSCQPGTAPVNQAGEQLLGFCAVEYKRFAVDTYLEAAESMHLYGTGGGGIAV